MRSFQPLAPPAATCPHVLLQFNFPTTRALRKSALARLLNGNQADNLTLLPSPSRSLFVRLPLIVYRLAFLLLSPLTPDRMGEVRVKCTLRKPCFSRANRAHISPAPWALFSRKKYYCNISRENRRFSKRARQPQVKWNP
jgi:hypothetical protein